MTDPFQTAFLQKMCNDRNEPCVILKANNPKFEIVACNKQFQAVSGTAHKPITGISVSEIHSWNSINEESAIRIHDALNEVISTKMIVHLPATRYDLPDESGAVFIPFWWQPSYEPILNEQGDVAHIFCTINQLSSQH